MADPTVTQLSSGVSASASVAVTSWSAVATGTLLTLHVVSDDYVNATPSGWSLAQNENTGFHGDSFFYKFSDGTETTVTYTTAGAFRSCYVVLGHTNVDNAAGLVVSGQAHVDSAGTTGATPSVTPVTGMPARVHAVATIGFNNSTTLFTDVASYTNSYVEKGQATTVATPGLIAGVAVLDFDATGSNSTSTTGTADISANGNSGIIAVFKVTTSVATGGTEPVTPTSGPGAGGPRAWQWQQRIGIDPISIVSVTATRATTWDALASATSTRATTWVAAAAVTSTRATTWTVRAAVTSTRATTWNVAASVSSTRATTWNVLASVSSTRATTWNVAGPVTSSRATTWNVAAAVTSSRATTWTVTTSVTSSRATTWNVVGPVTSSRATTWNVAQAVTSTRATTWTVAAVVTSTRTTTWVVTTSVTSTRATTWAVRASVTSTRSTTWNVALVTSTRTTTWNTRATVETTVSTTWNVFVRTFYTFTPPTTADHPLGFEGKGPGAVFRYFAAQPRGRNVWKLTDGTYTFFQPFDPALIAIEYLGGHEYSVSADERASLIAAGFTVT